MDEVLSWYNSGMKWVNAIAKRKPPLNANSNFMICALFVLCKYVTKNPPKTTDNNKLINTRVAFI